MPLSIRRALGSGYDDLTSESGLNVFSALLVFNVAYGAVSQSFRRELLAATRRAQPGTLTPQRFPAPFDLELLALELPLSLLAILTVAAVLGSEAIRFWAIQLFAGESSPSLQSRLTALVAAAGGLALLLYALRQLLPVVWLGSTPATTIRPVRAIVMVSAPLLLVTAYLRQEIALTEASLTGTVRTSVARFIDAPAPTFGLLLVLAVLGPLASLPAVVLSNLLTLRVGSTLALLTDVLSGVLAAGLSTFSIAVVTDAYLQLRDSGAAAGTE